MSSAPFTIEPRRGFKLRGKATREGKLWTLRLDAYPEFTMTGYDLAKARAEMERRAAARITAREEAGLKTAAGAVAGGGV